MTDTYSVCVTVGERQFALTSEEMSRMWDTWDGYNALTRWGYDPSRLVEIGLAERVSESSARLTDLGRAVVETRVAQVEGVVDRMRERGLHGTVCQRVYSAGKIAVSVEILEQILGRLTPVGTATP